MPVSHPVTDTILGSGASGLGGCKVLDFEKSGVPECARFQGQRFSGIGFGASSSGVTKTQH